MSSNKQHVCGIEKGIKRDKEGEGEKRRKREREKLSKEDGRKGR